MKCSYCEKEITKDENFYEIDNEFYCSDCVEERIIRCYVVAGETYDEDDVDYYQNRNRYIRKIEEHIRYHKESLEHYSQKDDKYSKNRVKLARKYIVKLKKRKRTVLRGGKNR